MEVAQLFPRYKKRPVQHLKDHGSKGFQLAIFKNRDFKVEKR